MNQRSFVMLCLVALMLIFGCSEDGIFKELKINSSELEKLQVVGFGTGRSVNPEIAQQKAKVNAQVNLVDQIAGRDFVYEKMDNSVNFKSTSKGMLSRTKLIDSYDIGNRTILTILSAPLQKLDFDETNTYLLETEFRTDNLEKALIEKYKIAVEETLARKYRKKAKLVGKIYLSDIRLSDFEGNSDFAVKLKILIVISNLEKDS